MKTGARRKARELGLSILFAADIGDQGSAQALLTVDHMLEVMVEHWEMDAEESEKLLPEIEEFGTELARAYFLDSRAIDELIEDFSHDWALDRMPGIDRNLLRLSLAELKHFPDVPISATINEAVEIAKVYGTEESGKFVNGILGAYVRSEQAPADGS